MDYVSRIGNRPLDEIKWDNPTKDSWGGVKARDFIPTIKPDTIQQFIINEGYAGVVGGVVVSQVEIPAGYGIVGAMAAYGLIAVANSGFTLWGSAGDLTAYLEGGEGSFFETVGNPFHGGVVGHAGWWAGKFIGNTASGLFGSKEVPIHK